MGRTRNIDLNAAASKPGYETTSFYLVKEDILPEAIKKTIKVKEILKRGEAKTINEAVERMNLSRSAYYKYKDSVLPFYEATNGKKVTLLITVENFQGILSSIINVISATKASILTINQNIPINGLADISISLDTASMFGSVEDIMNDINRIAGVRNCTVLSRE